MRASRRKILVFLSFVLLVVTVMGTVMYIVEGPKNGFVSAEFTAHRFRRPGAVADRACSACASTGHEATARFCRDCGAPLP